MFYRHKKRIGIKPALALLNEGAKIGRYILKKSEIRLSQEGISLRIKPSVVYVIFSRRKSCEILFRNVALFIKNIGIYKIRVSRKGGGRLIRRISEGGLGERQYLPYALPAVFQEINEFIRASSEGSYTVFRRQGEDWQQYSAPFHIGVPFVPKLCYPYYRTNFSEFQDGFYFFDIKRVRLWRTQKFRILPHSARKRPYRLCSL